MRVRMVVARNEYRGSHGIYMGLKVKREAYVANCLGACVCMMKVLDVAPKSPKLVLFIYFGPQSSCCLHILGALGP